MNADVPDGLIQTKEGFFVLSEDTHLSRWVEQHGRLDIAEGQIAFYQKHIPIGGIVIDAGASLGDHALTYAKLVGPSGRVLAIEPDALSFEALRLNFDRWLNVVTRHAALSDHKGRVVMHRQENVGASFIGTPGDDVDCITLDEEYLESLPRCDLIHLDVEGHEVRALNGAAKIIQKFQPALVLEVNHAALERHGFNEQSLKTLLWTLGYQCFELEPHLNSSYPQRDIIALPS